MFRHVDGESVHRLLDYPGLVAALRQAHAADAMPQVHASVMTDSGEAANKFVSLVAWASGDVIAVKLVGVFPANTGLTPPQLSVQGVVALMSGATGALR